MSEYAWGFVSMQVTKAAIKLERYVHSCELFSWATMTFLVFSAICAALSLLNPSSRM